MKNLSTLILAILATVGTIFSANASESKVEFETPQIQPAFSADEFIEFEKKALFDASNSKLISPSAYGRASFSWDFGDGSTMKWGQKVAHKFKNPGKYTVKLNVKQGRIRESIEREVVVFDRRGVVISDKISTQELVDSAGEHGIWLKTVLFSSAGAGFSEAEEFGRKVSENLPFLRESDLVIFDTDSADEFQHFAQFWRKLSEKNRFNPREKLWVQILETSFDASAKRLQSIFQILKPKFILLTRPESVVPIFEARIAGAVLEKLDARGIENRVIDERSRTSAFLPFSRLITYFVTHGISQNVVYLLLAVPILAFVISFFRQFVGISTFGVYAPLMLSLSFVVLGFKFGFLVFCIVWFVSYLIRLIFEKVELLYIPKISLLLSFLALSFFLVLGLAVYFESSINLTLAIFPMLVMATVSEKFLASQSEEGMKNAIIATIETVAVAICGYFFVVWDPIQGAVLAFPELILIPILGNVWLGRFTGLRMSEYFKFRSLWREDSQE